MTPEAAAFLGKAREFLVKARGMQALWPDEAGRAAYLAAFHAAQALMIEQTGKAARTHRGVHVGFVQLTRTDPDLPTELRAFLGRAYNLKAIADYDTGSIPSVSPDVSTAAIETADRFVAWVASRLPGG